MVPKVQPGQTLSISGSAKKKKKVLPTLLIEKKTLWLVVIYMVLTLTATECVDSYNHIQMCDPTKKKNKQVQTASPHKQTKKPKVRGNPFCLLHLNHILAMSSKFSPRQSRSLPPDLGC